MLSMVNMELDTAPLKPESLIALIMTRYNNTLMAVKRGS